MSESDVIWSGRPWIGPSVIVRTVVVVIVAVLLSVVLTSAGVLLTTPILSVPLLVWVLGILALAWLVSLAGLLKMRASYKYVLRRGSVEVDQGIARKRTLIVSPSGFSELEVDQGIIGRMLGYGSLEIRSQGGQQLNLRLIRNPKEVSAKIRDVMTTPTVRIAKDEVTPAMPEDSTRKT